MASLVFQRQLADILVNSGFPEDSLMPQAYNFHGPDSNLDVVCLNKQRSQFSHFRETKLKLCRA